MGLQSSQATPLFWQAEPNTQWRVSSQWSWDHQQYWGLAHQYFLPAANCTRVWSVLCCVQHLRRGDFCKHWKGVVRISRVQLRDNIQDFGLFRLQLDNSYRNQDLCGRAVNLLGWLLLGREWRHHCGALWPSTEDQEDQDDRSGEDDSGASEDVNNLDD